MKFLTTHCCQLKSDKETFETKSIDIGVEVVNSVARTTFVQAFKPIQHDISGDLSYLLPIADDFCVESFDVEVDGVFLKGLIKPKEEAKIEYEEKKKKGHRVALATREDNLPGVVSVRLGQFKTFKVLQVRVTFLESLSVSHSKFWSYVFYAAVPLKLLALANQWRIGDLVKGSVFSLKIEIYSTSKITFVNSPTHKIAVEYNHEQTSCKIALDSELQLLHLEKNFELLYRDEAIGKPNYALDYIEMENGKRKYCAMVTFFPEFDLRTVDDVLQAQIAGETSLEFVNSKGEFIFLLDRSGSMAGSRMQHAQTALKFFIKSLPTDCYVNIVSFGSNFKFMFSESQKYSPELGQQILTNIEKFKADLCGTEILKPLRKVLEAKPIQNYPRRIFLLTDGDVSNADRIISMTRENISKSVVSCIGVGDDVSKYLLSKLAKYGKGKASFIRDPEKIEDEAVNLLIQTNSPILEDFKLSLDKELVDFVSPNPENSLTIKKDDIFKAYIFFNELFEAAKKSKLTMKYFNSHENRAQEHELTIELNDQASFNFISKLGVYDLAAEAHFEGHKVTTGNILATRAEDVAEIIKKLCMEHNVLSKSTAFLIVEEQIQDPPSPMMSKTSFSRAYTKCRGGSPSRDRSRESMKKDRWRSRSRSKSLEKKLRKRKEKKSSRSRSRSKSLEKKSRKKKEEKGSRSRSRSFEKKSKKRKASGDASYQSRSHSKDLKKKSLKQKAAVNYDKVINESKLRDLEMLQKSVAMLSSIKSNNCGTESSSKSDNKDIILKTQTPEGFWDISEKLLDLIGIKNLKFAETCPPEIQLKMQKDAIWMTVIMIHWIAQTYKGSVAWTVVLKKAKDWIKAQGVDFKKFKIPDLMLC